VKSALTTIQLDALVALERAHLEIAERSRDGADASFRTSMVEFGERLSEAVALMSAGAEFIADEPVIEGEERAN
jgi:hypothetical protein